MGSQFFRGHIQGTFATVVLQGSLRVAPLGGYTCRTACLAGSLGKAWRSPSGASPPPLVFCDEPATFVRHSRGLCARAVSSVLGTQTVLGGGGN